MDRDQLANEGKIKYKKKFIQEATEETLERIATEYEMQQLDEANGQLTDILVKKFSEFMGKMELLKDSCKLEKDLSKNELLPRDVKQIVGYITPYISLIGVISGGITVGGHVVEKKMSSTHDCEEASD